MAAEGRVSDRLPYRAPGPDCDELRDVLLRKTRGRRVHFHEHGIDLPVLRQICREYLDIPWVELADDKKKHWDAVIRVHERLGYDALKVIGIDFEDRAFVRRKLETRGGTDSVTWSGWIESWKEFEEYRWPSHLDADYESIEYVHDHLPDGMGMFLSSHLGPFALVSNFFFGIENLSFFLIDEPDLVRAVFDRISGIKLRFMEQVIALPRVMGIWGHDDMGHKTATIVSPDFLREFNLPHHKKMAKLAHAHGKLHVLHSCGNMYSLMDDLIGDVGIDAKHSFEDAILPVADAYRQYGDRVGIIGGVDVDRLCRNGETELRDHVRSILESCMDKGGYVLGSGNSVASYVPVSNYLAMMAEGAAYTP